MNNLPQPSHQQLVNLLEVIRCMSDVRDLGELLAYIGEHCTKAIEADRCTVFLLDQEKGELWSRYSQGQDEEIRFSADLGIAGDCVRKNHTLLIEDPYNHPLFNDEVDRKTGYRTRNILCMPLRNIEEEVVGCFQVINKLSGDFSAIDESMLSAFASQAGIAVETALLVAERGRMIHRLRAVADIEHFVLNGNDIEGFAQTSMSKVLEPTDADAAFFWLKNDDDEVDAYFLDGSVAKPMQSLGIEVLGASSSDGGLRQSLQNFTKKAIRAELSLPLLDHEGETVGYIGLISYDRKSFNRHDHTLCEILASRISSVYQRQQLMIQQAMSERLATVGQLMTTILHDIRNPISTVYGFCSLLMDDDIVGEERQKYLGFMERELERCNSMTDEFLAFARGDSEIHYRNVEISEFFAALTISIQNQADKHGVNLTIDLQVEDEVSIDSDRLARVIYNLANNAMDAMKDKGDLRIALIAVPDHDSLLEIRIEDTGPGIPKKSRHRIFEAFYTKGKSGGTGLGLHISKDIVEAHGGSLTLDEAYDKGAAFVIRIPRKGVAKKVA